MPSVRSQIFRAIEEKLDAVLAALEWRTRITNPREPIGEDQMNAILFAAGGDLEPGSLTGNVDTHTAEFAVGLVVVESESGKAETLLDQGFVAICDALLSPDDIQLGGLVTDLRRGGMSPPFFGRARSGARVVGVQEIEFSTDYWVRQGDASQVGP